MAGVVTDTITLADIDDADKITDPELRALQLIEQALLPLSHEERVRVIRCVAILYSADIPGLTSPLPRSTPPAPPAPLRRFFHKPSTWRWRPKPRKPRACRGCKATDHDWRKCPLNFEITVEEE